MSQFKDPLLEKLEVDRVKLVKEHLQTEVLRLYGERASEMTLQDSIALEVLNLLLESNAKDLEGRTKAVLEAYEIADIIFAHRAQRLERLLYSKCPHQWHNTEGFYVDRCVICGMKKGGENVPG